MGINIPPSTYIKFSLLENNDFSLRTSASGIRNHSKTLDNIPQFPIPMDEFAGDRPAPPPLTILQPPRDPPAPPAGAHLPLPRLRGRLIRDAGFLRRFREIRRWLLPWSASSTTSRDLPYSSTQPAALRPPPLPRCPTRIGALWTAATAAPSWQTTTPRRC
jgi:hypothetical protein